MENHNEEESALKMTRRAAYRLLAIRNRLSDDLREKLKAKELPESAIEKVIEECKQMGYLNDDENIKRFIERSLSRGYGPLWIAAKLGKKVRVESEQQITALRSHLKKKSKLASDLTIAEKQKLFLKLKRRGFDHEAIMAVIRADGEN